MSNSNATSGLGVYLSLQVMLLTQDGRLLTGVLQGFDNVGSVILSNTVERIFSSGDDGEEGGMEELDLGLYVLRGDAICLIGDVDLEKDKSIKWGEFRVDGIPEVRHQ